MPNHKKKPTQRGRRKKTTEKAQKQPVAHVTEVKRDLINGLNDDCLAKIFKGLSLPQRLGMERVCKRWKEVSVMAWDDIKELNLKSKLPRTTELSKAGLSANLNHYAAMVIKRCGRFLDRLKIGEPCSYKLLPLVGQHCYNLTRLEIDFNNYDKHSAKVFSQLRKLNYLKMDGIKQHLPGEILSALPVESLTEVHLFADIPYENMDGDNVVFLPRIAPHVFVNLKNLKALTLDLFAVKPNLMKIIGEKKDLTHLNLANCQIRRNFYVISHLSNLEHLNLSCAEVTDHFVEKMAGNCPNLRYLNLTECLMVSDYGLNHVQQLKKLEELLVNDSMKITDESLSKLHHLNKLECSGCSEIADNGLITLIEHAHNLEYLNVGNTGVTEKLLVEATHSTNKRTNGVALRIVVNDYVKRDWQQEVFSPLLIIQGIDDTDILSGSDLGFSDYSNSYYNERLQAEYDCLDIYDSYTDFDDDFFDDHNVDYNSIILL